MAGKRTANSPSVWDQYRALKQQQPDTLLFFRLGDFYETFDDDARLVARELQLTLTSRPVAAGKRVPMVGVPFHSIDTAATRLIARGYGIALAEQLDQTPTQLAPEGNPRRRREPEPPQPPAGPVSERPTQLTLPL